MKICNIGGAYSLHVNRIAKWFAEKDHDVAILSGQLFEVEGVNVYNLYERDRDKTLEVCFELKLNLLKGLYKIGFNILNSSDEALPGHIEYMNDVSSFLVKENVSVQGIAYLEPRVSLTFDCKG